MSILRHLAILILVVASALPFSSIPAAAATLLSNATGADDHRVRLGPNGNDINTVDIGWTMGAEAFTLDSVSIALDKVKTGATATLQIFSGAGAPDTLLSTLTATGPLADGENIYTDAASTLLSANTSYWLRLVDDSSEKFDWRTRAAMPTGPGISSFQGYFFNGVQQENEFLAFSVAATFVPVLPVELPPVPLPAGMVLMLTAIGALVLRGRARRAA